MRVFLSWSGEPSKQVALALKEWLPEVVNALEPWMSEKDITAGAQWFGEISRGLEAAKFGIVCLTRSNLSSPWLLFESGALAKQVGGPALVCPYRFRLDWNDVTGPLSNFQGVDADEPGTEKLVRGLNEAVAGAKEKALDEESLKRVFARSYPALKAKLDPLQDESSANAPPKRTAESMIEETLGLVRGLAASQEAAGPWRVVQGGPLWQAQVGRVIPWGGLEETDTGFIVRQGTPMTLVETSSDGEKPKEGEGEKPKKKR